jgi:hypothetical protein
MSSAVTMVTDEGASVTRCSRFAAPNTVPTSTDMRSSRLLSARPPAGSGGVCALADAATEASTVSRRKAEGVVSLMTAS